MNILIHATLYPESETEKRQNTTMFMHYYAAEWVRSGHHVLVLHHKVSFPRWMVTLGRAASSHLPGLGRARDYLSGYGDDDDRSFSRNGVEIVRQTIHKLAPRTLFSSHTITHRAEMARAELERRSFVPDMVVCDFINPGLFVALVMKQSVRAPVAAILHNSCMGYFARPHTAKRALAAVRTADMLAFRSGEAEAEFSGRYFVPQKWFLMPSGVPTDMTRPPDQMKVRTKVLRFVCVGRLGPGKHVDAVIEAFGRLEQYGATLTIVGEGPDRSALEKLATSQPNASTIHFTGAITRKQALEQMERADCLVLISERETFGMVYVEAMSTGAIPVGSPVGGVRDFIKHGENGFVSPAGDAVALATLLTQMMALPESEVRRMSQNAYQTTRDLRDDVLAQSAITNLFG